jgi:hypothetical protein
MFLWGSVKDSPAMKLLPPYIPSGAVSAIFRTLTRFTAAVVGGIQGRTAIADSCNDQKIFMVPHEPVKVFAIVSLPVGCDNPAIGMYTCAIIIGLLI